MTQLAASLLYNTTCSAGLGALSAWIISANPIVGTVFGATHAVTSLVTNSLFEKMGWNPQNPILKVGQVALSLIISIGTAVGACSALGFSLTLKTAVVLTAVSAVLPIAIGIVAVGAGAILVSAISPRPAG